MFGGDKPLDVQAGAQLVGDGLVAARLPDERVDRLLVRPSLLRHHIGKVDGTPRGATTIDKAHRHTMDADRPLVDAAGLKGTEQLDGALEGGQLALLHGREAPVVQRRVEGIVTE